MPNRILREGIIESEQVNALSPGAELLYRRIMSKVDDYGRYYGHPALVRGACYPLRLDSVSDQDIAVWLSECVAQELITTYEVDGKKYLEVNKFGQRTRTDSKFPAQCAHNDRAMSAQCPQDASTLRLARARSESESYAESETKTEPLAFVRRVPPPRVVPTSPVSQRFEEFWDKYPIKENKSISNGVWETLVSPLNEDAVFACLDRYLASDRAERSPKNPSNWLHDCARDEWKSSWPAKARDPTAKEIRPSIYKRTEASEMGWDGLVPGMPEYEAKHGKA